MNFLMKHFVILSALLSTTSFGAVVRDITFPEKVDVSGAKLILNGTAVRKATWFKVAVYAAGLYTAEKSSAADQILSATTPRMLRMHFLRDVDAEKIRDTWGESFAANCEIDCEDGKKKLSIIQAKMPSVKKGDVMTCVFGETGVEVELNGTLLATVQGPVFQKNLLSNWLGKNPPDTEVKEGLLGKARP